MLFSQQWESSWEDALARAEAEKKNILLVFSGSDWCIPCIKMEKTVWSSSTFDAYAKSSLVTYRADFPKRKKNKLPESLQNEHNGLAEKYNPNGYFPWVVVLSPAQTPLDYFAYEKIPVEAYIKKLEKL